MKMTVVLHNIRSVYNVGAILRTAEGFGVEEVVFSGYTPFPGARSGVLPHVTEKVTERIAKTALGAEKMVKCVFADDILEFLQAKTRSKALIVALENNIPQSRLKRLSEFRGPQSGSPAAGTEVAASDGASEAEVVLVLGEEVTGVDEALYPYIAQFYEIPMRGRKESFNVSVAAGIAMYAMREALS